VPPRRTVRSPRSVSARADSSPSRARRRDTRCRGSRSARRGQDKLGYPETQQVGRSAHRDQQAGPAMQCRGPDHGNAEQDVTDHEQDRRQPIDDHHRHVMDYGVRAPPATAFAKPVRRNRSSRSPQSKALAVGLDDFDSRSTPRLVDGPVEPTRSRSYDRTGSLPFGDAESGDSGTSKADLWKTCGSRRWPRYSQQVSRGGTRSPSGVGPRAAGPPDDEVWVNTGLNPTGAGQTIRAIGAPCGAFDIYRSKRPAGFHIGVFPHTSGGAGKPY
jgi:hypothetical protein